MDTQTSLLDNLLIFSLLHNMEQKLNVTSFLYYISNFITCSSSLQFLEIFINHFKISVVNILTKCGHFLRLAYQITVNCIKRNRDWSGDRNSKNHQGRADPKGMRRGRYSVLLWLLVGENPSLKSLFIVPLSSAVTSSVGVSNRKTYTGIYQNVCLNYNRKDLMSK